MIKKIRAGVLLLFFLLLSFEACKAGDAEKEAGTKGWKEAADAAENEEQVKKSSSDTTCYTFEDVEGNSYQAELLDEVAKNPYNFKNLVTDPESGYKTYSDTKKHISSKLGVDVSEFQGEDTDWQQVKESGIDFVIVRLGYRAYGESGVLVLDDMFDQNVQGALSAGLEVGVYFFSQATTLSETVEEADFVLEHIRQYDITAPVVFDTEDDAMIYANMKWMAFTLKLEELEGYDFWYADYHEEPQCPYAFKMWQYSETGEVPGITGHVDLDLWFQEEN